MSAPSPLDASRQPRSDRPASARARGRQGPPESEGGGRFAAHLDEMVEIFNAMHGELIVTSYSRAREVCSACGVGAVEGAELKVCTGCLYARYCGRECQRAAWPAHKIACPLLASDRDVYEAFREGLEQVSLL